MLEVTENTHTDCNINVVIVISQYKSNMPVRKVAGGYQWGKSGKVYPTAAQAERQGRAIIASGWREKK